MSVALIVLLMITQSVSGSDICIEGFVMDVYCINLGTLLDNSAVVTLDGPDRHSVHCLIDVPVCRDSGFEILLPNPSGSPKYGRAFTLDKPGNQMVIDHARKVGICTTCKGAGTLKEGLRATIYGNVTKVNGRPDVITVSSLDASPILSGMESDSCKNGTTKINITLFENNNVALANITTGVTKATTTASPELTTTPTKTTTTSPESTTTPTKTTTTTSPESTTTPTKTTSPESKTTPTKKATTKSSSATSIRSSLKTQMLSSIFLFSWVYFFSRFIH